MRRQLVLLVMVVALALPLLLSLLQSAAMPSAQGSPGPTAQLPPIHAIERPRQPHNASRGLSFHRPLHQSHAPAAPIPALPDAPVPSEPRLLDLEALPPEARATLGQAAMDKLGDLSEACGSLAPEVALGAFASFDRQGLAELELRPLRPGESGAPIEPLDEPLSPDFERCVDDHLWEQDWSDAGLEALPEGALLKVALTLRPWAEEHQE